MLTQLMQTQWTALHSFYHLYMCQVPFVVAQTPLPHSIDFPKGNYPGKDFLPLEMEFSDFINFCLQECWNFCNEVKNRFPEWEKHAIIYMQEELYTGLVFPIRKNKPGLFLSKGIFLTTNGDNMLQGKTMLQRKSMLQQPIYHKKAFSNLLVHKIWIPLSFCYKNLKLIDCVMC